MRLSIHCSPVPLHTSIRQRRKKFWAAEFNVESSLGLLLSKGEEALFNLNMLIFNKEGQAQNFLSVLICDFKKLQFEMYY